MSQEEKEKKKANRERYEIALNQAILYGKGPDGRDRIMKGLFVFKITDNVSLVFGKN